MPENQLFGSLHDCIFATNNVATIPMKETALRPRQLSRSR